MTDDFAQIAAELYSGPLDEFVAARNARAKDAADPGLAQQLRALRKPSVAAWAVNVFATERASELAQALQLAEELREAQADLDAQTLAKLGRQRRALTDRLADEAAELASARGGRVTAATRDAVRQTIAAAFFDPDAAAAVASGRLTRELEASGTLDLDAVVGGGHSAAPQPAAPPVDELKARRERRKAERDVREAEKDLTRAHREQADAERAARDAAQHIDQLAERETQLQAELAQVREQLDEARADAPGLDERKESSSAAVAAAEDALHAAQAALQRLT